MYGFILTKRGTRVITALDFFCNLKNKELNKVLKDNPLSIKIHQADICPLGYLCITNAYVS